MKIGKKILSGRYSGLNFTVLDLNFNVRTTIQDRLILEDAYIKIGAGSIAELIENSKPIEFLRVVTRSEKYPAILYDNRIEVRIFDYNPPESSCRFIYRNY